MHVRLVAMDFFKCSQWYNANKDEYIKCVVV